MCNKNKLTIIIPCYNEEKVIFNTIQEVYKIFNNKDIDFKIITVNDGSSDNSLAEIKKAKDKTEIVNLEKNCGYGYAIKQGLKTVNSKWVGIIDADMTYNPSDLITLWNNKANNDMVVGARTGEKVKIPLLRRPAKFLLRKFASWLVKYPIPDLNSGIRIFKRDSALRFYTLYPNGFSLTTTITMSFLSNNLNVKYIPINYNKREGKSKIQPFKDTYNFILLIIKLTVYYNPLKIFLPISLTMFLLFLFSLGYDIFVINNIGDKTILLITISLLTFLQGLTADLIIKRTKL